MHGFLKSIGYNTLTSQAETEDLIKRVIEYPDSIRSYKKPDGTMAVEYLRYSAKDSGIIVAGEEGPDGVFHFGHYFPFGTGETEACTEEEIWVSKRVESEALTGMCDDPRLGISLIFYVINQIEYMDIFKGERCLEGKAVRYTGLAQSGKIILPTYVRSEDSERIRQENVKKNMLIAEAKKGNQEAIESLTMEDIDRYAMVSQRIRNEDMLSIIDTCIAPFGSESDMYKITGIIKSCDKTVNKDTKEEIHHMVVLCNGIPIEVFINSDDLFGEPQEGRRFRGNVWLQGQLIDVQKAAV